MTARFKQVVEFGRCGSEAPERELNRGFSHNSARSRVSHSRRPSHRRAKRSPPHLIRHRSCLVERASSICTCAPVRAQTRSADPAAPYFGPPPFSPCSASAWPPRALKARSRSRSTPRNRRPINPNTMAWRRHHRAAERPETARSNHNGGSTRRRYNWQVNADNRAATGISRASPSQRHAGRPRRRVQSPTSGRRTRRRC